MYSISARFRDFATPRLYDAREHLDENAQTLHGPLTVDSPGLSIYTIEHYACKLS